MLKIKDNVELKELEKFGFNLCKRNDYGHKTRDDIYRNNDEDINVFIKDTDYWTSRILYMMNYDSSYQESPDFEFPNVLYDLIKADLVEKAEDESNK